jgi:hypothetical protein
MKVLERTDVGVPVIIPVFAFTKRLVITSTAHK